MEKQPLFDRSALAPIVLGIFSVFGICLVLLVGRFGLPRGQAPADNTATPYKYLLIGTEPGISTPSEFDASGTGIPGNSSNDPIPGFAITAQQGFQNSSSDSSSKPTSTSSSEILTAASNPSQAPIIVFDSGSRTPTSELVIVLRTPTATRTPPNTITVTPSRTRSVTQTTSANTGLPTNTPTRTPTSISAAPLNPGTYDDTDSHLVYSGDWTSQNNVSGAYLQTLHLSSTLNGNSVTFRFIGREIRLFYQSGPSLGTIRISLDGAQFDLDESDSSSQTSEWVSPTLVEGTHTVIITHVLGGSVNLDFIIVPEPGVTATPTPTPTSTP